MRGWGLVWGYTLAAVVWAAGVLLVVEPVDEALRMVMRGTARGSVALFSLSFAAPAFGRRLREHAGWLFVTFAASHVVHAIAITTLAVMTRGQSLGGRINVSHLGGLVTYAVILAIASGHVRRGGADPATRGWARAREVGLHYVWLSFALAYLGNSMDRPRPFPVVMLVLVLVLLPLRWGGRLSRAGGRDAAGGRP